MKSTVVLATLLLLAACGTVGQKEAEQAAVDFVRLHVVAYTQQGVGTEAVQAPEVEVLAAERSGGAWVITLQLSSVINSSVKKSIVTVTIDARAGEVTHFNDKPVPRS